MKALLFLLFFLLSKTAAQTELVGLVKDENGGVIVGAEVLLKSADFKARTTTDENGRFVFDNLPSSGHKFQLEIRAVGFQLYLQELVGISKIEVVLKTEDLRFTVTAESEQRVERRMTPQSVSVIGRENILDCSTVVLAEAGKKVGINIQRTSPTIEGFFVRGLAGKT